MQSERNRIVIFVQSLEEYSKRKVRFLDCVTVVSIAQDFLCLQYLDETRCKIDDPQVKSQNQKIDLFTFRAAAILHGLRTTRRIECVEHKVRSLR